MVSHKHSADSSSTIAQYDCPMKSDKGSIQGSDSSARHANPSVIFALEPASKRAVVPAENEVNQFKAVTSDARSRKRVAFDLAGNDVDSGLRSRRLVQPSSTSSFKLDFEFAKTGPAADEPPHTAHRATERCVPYVSPLISTNPALSELDVTACHYSHIDI